MIWLQAVVVLALLFVTTFSPGFFVLRRCRWSAIERLCGSVALSLMFLWLTTWTIYVSGTPMNACYAVSAICVAMGAASFRDFSRLAATVRVRQTLWGFGFLLLWLLVALSIVRVYSGAGWSGDWLEHFQRALFFAERFPPDQRILGNYLLPARPPAQNLLAAFFLAQTATRFELFQIAFTFLNLLPFLACCLVLPLLGRGSRFGVTPLTVLFAVSPVFVQNATYTWTKGLTAFFVLLAIPIYLRGWRRGCSARMMFAFSCLAMGMLCHYSAGPYLLFFAFHYLIAVWPSRSAKWRELAAISLVGGALLATWMVWSLDVYGVKATLASNTSITESQAYDGDNLAKIVGNVWDSLIPHWLRSSELSHGFDQPNFMGFLRDNIFLTYQVQLLFSMGSIGGLLVGYLLVRSVRREVLPLKVRRFWLWLLVMTVGLGLAVVGERNHYGTAHLTLQPVSLLGITLLASRVRSSRWMAILLLVGCVVDFGAGVFLHLRVQHLENTAGKTYYHVPTALDGGRTLPDELSPTARGNWYRKHHEESNLFRGWYGRNGGSITYLGDHFGDSNVPSALLLALFGALLYCQEYGVRIRDIPSTVHGEAR